MIIRLKSKKFYPLAAFPAPHAFTILSVSASKIAPQLTRDNLARIDFLTDDGLVSGIYTDKQLVSCTQSGDDVDVRICDRYDIVIDVGADGRIAGVRYPKFAATGDTVVEKLPDGELADYRYVDGQYVYDPLPDPEPEPDAPTLEERVEVLETTTDDMILLMADLIGGE